VSDKETRRKLFESEDGAKLLKQLERDRDGTRIKYKISGQVVFEEALESKMKQYSEVRKGHCEALRNAGYKENLDDLTDKELAEFIGSEGFGYLEIDPADEEEDEKEN